MENSEQKNSTDCDSEPIRMAKTLLTINEAYKETIDEKIVKLRKQLEANQLEQDSLTRALLNDTQDKLHSKDKQARRNTREEISCMKQNEIELNKIKSSYFKDRFNSEPPNDEVVKRKSKLEFYDYIPQLKPEWTLKYRNILKAAVMKDALRLLKLPLTQRISFLEEKLNHLEISMSASKNKLRQIQSQLKETKLQSRLIDKYSEAELLSEISTDRIDWMKIAKIDLDSHWTSTECRLVWTNVCSPQINQEKWTQAELKLLVDLARKYKEKNWEKIALELNTSRSAFLCMKRYHEKTVDMFCKRDWEDAETLELCAMAEKLRVGQYVPYNYLCYLNGTRDRNSIYNWHIKVDPNLNHGKWTHVEEAAFEEALTFYNTVYNWQEISEHVMTRTAHQCKDRYELKYHNPEKYINWTIEDDKKLLESYRKYDGQWYKIAAFEFPNRNDNACLFRYTRLMTWHKQNTWFNQQSSEIQEFILFICKQKKKYRDEPQVYTENGEPVPKKPMFAQNITNLVDQIIDKTTLIEEFIHKKRQGQLNLNLINKIGIYTPALNATIVRYKKHFQLTPSNATESSSKSARVQMKSMKAEENRIKRETLKLERNVNKERKNVTVKKKADTANRKIKLKDLVHMPGTDTTTTQQKKNDKLENFKALLTKKRERNANKQIDRKKMESLKRKKSKLRTINHYLKSRGDEERPKNILPHSEQTRLNKTQPNQEDTISSDCVNNTDFNNDLPSSTPMPLTSNITKSKACSNSIRNLTGPNQSSIKRKIKSYIPISPTSKKPKREILHTKAIKPVSTTNSHLKTLKDLKLYQIEKNLKPSELSPLVVKFEEVPDEEKIPCVTEQSSMFKFMYLLKKNATNSKYFFKYTIIKFADRFVAIKPFNSSQITTEYLTEARLGAISKVLDQIVVRR